MREYTLDEINNIINNAASNVVSDESQLVDFLKRSAYFYKYTLPEQLVITAVKPNAIACGNKAVWRSLNSEVKPGADGIPLFYNDKQGKTSIKYVYDISDTDSDYKIWQLKEVNENYLKEALSEAFGIEQKDIGSMLFDISNKIIDTLFNPTNLNYDLFMINCVQIVLFSRCGGTLSLPEKPEYDISELLPNKSFAAFSKLYAPILAQTSFFLKEIEKCVNIAKKREKAEKEKSSIMHTEKSSDEEKKPPSPKNDINIIGNTPYKYISDKKYRKLDTKTALKVRDVLLEENIKFSGKINGNFTTLTLSGTNIKRVDKIIAGVKEAERQSDGQMSLNDFTQSFSPEDIEKARNTNLIDFLHTYGEEIRPVGTNEYTLKSHDSMRISGNKFYWNSRSIGGNALDFCINYYNMDFQTAIKTLLHFDGRNFSKPIPPININDKSSKTAAPTSEPVTNPLPNELDTKTNRVYAYLTKTRMIDGYIVSKLIENGSIAQDIKGNVVYKIFDENGSLSGAEISGTLTDKRYKQTTEHNGNGFVVNPTDSKPDRAIFFESAVDLLSYYSLHRDETALMVSMSGLKDKVVVSTLDKYGIMPAQCLISSDNDKAGRDFANKMYEKYDIKPYSLTDDELFSNEYENIKDWNDLLKRIRTESIDKPKTSKTNEVSESREKTFAEQVDDVLNNRYSRYNDLKVCDTPQILLDVGCEQLPVFYTQRHLRDAVKPKGYKGESIHHHGLSVDQIKKLPELLMNPVLIYDSLSSKNNDSIVIVTTEFDKDNLPIIAVIRPNGEAKYEMEITNSNFLLSVHGRENFKRQFVNAYNEDKILYCDKEKSQALFSVLGLQLSKGLNNLDYNRIIHQSRNIVKQKNSEISANNEEKSNISQDVNSVQIANINSIPTITCEWSESPVFEDNKTYSIVEFDRLMKQADDEWVMKKQQAIDRYGDSFDAVYEAYQKGEIEGFYLGYNKVKFTLNMPDGRTFTERQDIGDGDGGVIDFLSQYDKYKDIVPILKEIVKNDISIDQNTSAAKAVTTSKQAATYEPIQAENFHIADEDYNVGTPKEKCRQNIEAIRTLKLIESENRNATPDEQKILGRYVGWGGLQEVFDDSKTAWSKEYKEVKDLLTKDEYESARASTLNAHYTTPVVIDTIYKVLDNLGFESGRILEPAMGIGNFFGRLTEKMKTSKLYGVELDSITGRIAQKLYPNANIQIKGFEKTDFQSHFFDAAIGNVPFGNYRVIDKDFKDGDLIHDYFFKKALDKIHPGGIVAFITSKGTMDKQDTSVREYLAERADLLGTIRLPNNAFLKNAGTEVTTDIIFLQKRENIRDLSVDPPEWLSLGTDDNGVELNSYFINHPEMLCGTMVNTTSQFGFKTACVPFDGIELKNSLDKAAAFIKGKIFKENSIIPNEILGSEPLDSTINPEDYKNFCYHTIDDKIYYRENNEMLPQNFVGKKAERMKGLIEISYILQKLINAQSESGTDEEISKLQHKLNSAYDNFTKKFGIISSTSNKSLMKDDDTYPLLSALENLDNEGKFLSKADIFTKRTIKPYIPVTSVDTAIEALAVSISEKAKVDLDFMSELCSKSKEEIINDLREVIFENPITKEFENADEYLSGNVREKLRIAKEFADKDSKYDINVKSLEAVQPKDLKPSEISVQLGSTWIPVDIYQQFMYELLNTSSICRADYIYRHKNPFESGLNGDSTTVMIDYDEYTSTYGISNNSNYYTTANNPLVYQTYGTSRMSAYKIIENTLNMKPIKVFDYYKDVEGKTHSVLNERETLLAQEKQNIIKQKFNEWIFDDADRTEMICRLYNEKFNSLRPREYDGSHINFVGMNPCIQLMKHQRDAVAHTLYGGNTLLAHVVGAGKTFEMAASAMESKRLGLCSKSLVCVPKSIVNQFAKEFMQLYPSANILVPGRNDFSAKNRQRFLSRIATGNYDAIIISHEQLEKIPLSQEKQKAFIQSEIAEIVSALNSLKYDKENRGFTIKQMEAAKKQLENRLNSLNNDKARDNVVTFEELGVDRLYIDEAHNFKNCYFNSKMTNVAGINTSSASQRAMGLLMKCRYLDEKTGSKGVVFATGTPISNSMAEMFVMQNYLQYDELKKQGLNHFDAWASSFGETVQSLELAPEGKGYQIKTRFAKFFNLPELMSMFKEIADVKTADVLNLPVPKANYHTITSEASEYQSAMVDGLAERAGKIRKRLVNQKEDNMLNVTNDGRKLALDQRLLNPLLPDETESKVNKCVDNVYNIWSDTKADRSAQIIFSDLSTPKKDGSFSVYNDIKDKLINKGIPEKEIAFIHDFNTDEQKQALFSKVRNGEIRVLMGSTGKLGTGTNCQDRLKALHHIDCPYRPSDLEQRNGRAIRQGNMNESVDIYNYITKGTFDAYLYQIVENKQKFISQIMTSKSSARTAEDIDESVLNYAQIKALAAGDPKIKEKIELDIEVNKLRTLFNAYQDNKRKMQNDIAKNLPQKISYMNTLLKGYQADNNFLEKSKTENFPGMLIDSVFYEDKKSAGAALIKYAITAPSNGEPLTMGSYRGFELKASFDKEKSQWSCHLKNNLTYDVVIGNDPIGNITRIDNLLSKISDKINNTKAELSAAENQLTFLCSEVNKPFPQLEELETKEQRLTQLNKELTTVEDNSAPAEKIQDKPLNHCKPNNDIAL